MCRVWVLFSNLVVGLHSALSLEDAVRFCVCSLCNDPSKMGGEFPYIFALLCNNGDDGSSEWGMHASAVKDLKFVLFFLYDTSILVCTSFSRLVSAS